MKQFTDDEDVFANFTEDQTKAFFYLIPIICTKTELSNYTLLFLFDLKRLYAIYSQFDDYRADVLQLSIEILN